jgi:hypothetical protein
VNLNDFNEKRDYSWPRKPTGFQPVGSGKPAMISAFIFQLEAGNFDSTPIISPTKLNPDFIALEQKNGRCTKFSRL